MPFRLLSCLGALLLCLAPVSRTMIRESDLQAFLVDCNPVPAVEGQTMSALKLVKGQK